MRISPLSLLAWLGLVLLAAAPAQAQYVAQREYERMLDHGQAAVTTDVNTFFGKVSGARDSLVQPTVMAAARYREAVFEAALPFGYLHQNNSMAKDQNRMVVGNPWFALAYLPDCSCGLSRLSLGMAVDASSTDTPLKARASSLARAAMGDWDGYLWIDHMLPLVAGASTRVELGMVRLSWDGDLIFALPVRTRDFNFGMQNAGELALLFNWHLQIAGRASVAYYPTMSGDNLQSALQFYFRYVVVTDSFGMRFNINLDPPNGFSFNSDRGVWGLGVFYATHLGR
ncbi:MAG: hypothetical protein JWN04_6717 [Myxococcaceae bacterium]|nr:hypothetical protein [Myxococcaceae bacterium]